MNEAAFLGGGTYVNIHTAAFPGGAIRGQLFSAANVNLTSGATTGTTGVAFIENVTGGAGGDSLVGSFSANMLNGGGGADWIVGGPGADTFGGDAGADVLVWSNGDGSDVMEGGADGDTVVVNGSTAGADVFQVAANGARLDFDRISPGPFSLDIGTAEILTVNGIGGDDSVTTNDLAGVASLATLNLNGFDGNDTFAYAPTSAGAVVFNAHGGPGTDTIQGPNGASTWNVTAANAGNIAGLVASFRFIETLTGGTAVDTFNVRAFAAGALTVNGGDAADTLNYDAEARAVSGDTTPPDGVIDSPGVQSVTFTQIELVYLLNASNTPPTITPIANQTILANSSTAALAFTIGDLETPAGNLTVSGSSSNPALVPTPNIVFGGSGASRTVTVTPAADGTGTATITVVVSDGTTSTPTAFLLTVNVPTTVQPPNSLHVSALSGNLVTLRFRPSTLGPAATGFVLEGGIVTWSGAGQRADRKRRADLLDRRTHGQLLCAHARDPGGGEERRVERDSDSRQRPRGSLGSRHVPRDGVWRQRRAVVEEHIRRRGAGEPGARRQWRGHRADPVGTIGIAHRQRRATRELHAEHAVAERRRLQPGLQPGDRDEPLTLRGSARGAVERAGLSHRQHRTRRVGSASGRSGRVELRPHRVGFVRRQPADTRLDR